MQIKKVDDTRLELVTSRTSSGCATSCANRLLREKTPDFTGFYCSYSSLLSTLETTLSREQTQYNTRKINLQYGYCYESINIQLPFDYQATTK